MAGLQEWLHTHAEQLDLSAQLANAVLPALGDDGWLRIGVPTGQGGTGGDTRDAIEAIAKVAEQSLTTAFVYWGQRTFIEYLLQSPNASLRERRLPDLLAGKQAGATGLSNAMKFLSGMEQLQIAATPQETGWRLDGALAWVTNLRTEGSVVAAAVAPSDGAPPAIIAIDSQLPGVERSADLELIALRGSNTASLKLNRVEVSADDVITSDALTWLPRVRPAFLGMQCGMSIGLARASLRQAGDSGRPEPLLAASIAQLQQTLERVTAALHTGVQNGSFITRAPELFRLRIQLAELVQQASMLELQAKGGGAYLLQDQHGWARRWRESAFIPIVTPSLTQLRAALAKAA
jgi:alkylation response protein AidB-like acyl-CoA dehydrogenase